MKSFKALWVALLSAALIFTGAGPIAAAPTEVTMVLWPGPEGDAMQKVVDRYNATQGKRDGVRVEQILLSRSDTFSKEAALMKAKSSEYDVYFTASYLVAQHAPFLTPIQGVDRSKYLKSAVDGLRVNNQQMALPLDTSLHFMYYRKDLVKALSTPANRTKYRAISRTVLGKALNPNTNPNTWTWDDAIATAAFYTQQYNPDSPTRYGYALPAKNLLFNTMIWNDILWGLGGNWLKNGKPAINTPEGRRAIGIYRSIYTKGLTSPDSSQWEYAETNSALTSGNAMMALQWNAAYPELSTTGATAGNIGIARPPGSGPRTHVHALAVGLNKYGKNQAAAQKWMSYLATERAMRAYAKNGGTPSMPAVLNTMVKDNASYANLIRYANTVGYSRPPLKREFDIYAALAEQLSPAWVGQSTAAAAAKKADRAMARLIRR
jgi:multiple sugar transport system substrate-binding protein